MAWRSARGGILLLSGTGLLSFHLLLVAGMLADAAVYPEDLKSLPVPIGLALSATTVSFLARKLYLLAGTRAAVAESMLEECGTELGLDWAREGGRLIFKREGAA